MSAKRPLYLGTVSRLDRKNGLRYPVAYGYSSSRQQSSRNLEPSANITTRQHGAEAAPTKPQFDHDVRQISLLKPARPLGIIWCHCNDASNVHAVADSFGSFILAAADNF